MDLSSLWLQKRLRRLEEAGIIGVTQRFWIGSSMGYDMLCLSR
ncbi:MAG: hypothetical protein R3C44_12670 [Chloroflexota bacterium]